MMDLDFDLDFSEEEERELELAHQELDQGVESAEGIARFARDDKRVLLEPWLRKGTIGMIHAPSKTGKTWFSMQLAFSLATQTEFLNYGVPSEKLKVLYIDGECGRTLIGERLRLFQNAVSNSSLNNLKVMHCDMWNGVMPWISEESAQDAVYGAIVAKADVVVVDNETCLSGERTRSDSESQKVRRIMHWYIKLKQMGKTVIHIHHSRKSLNEFGKVEQAGTSERTRPLDWSISLQKLPGLDNIGFAISFDGARHFVAPKDMFATLSTETGAIEWAVKDIDEVNLARVKVAYRKLKKWNEVAACLKLSPGYIHELRVRYDLDADISAEQDAEYWNDVVEKAKALPPEEDF